MPASFLSFLSFHLSLGSRRAEYPFFYPTIAPCASSSRRVPYSSYSRATSFSSLAFFRWTNERERIRTEKIEPRRIVGVSSGLTQDDMELFTLLFLLAANARRKSAKLMSHWPLNLLRDFIYYLFETKSDFEFVHNLLNFFFLIYTSEKFIGYNKRYSSFQTTEL